MKVEFKYKGKIVCKETEIAALLIGITTFTTFYMYLITEFFSAFQALNGRNVKVAWGILFLGIVLLKFRYSIKIYVNKFIWKDNKILIPVFLIGMIVGLIALFTVPYNFDSMTYHLARVVNWEQNQSINFYATNNERQVFNSPLAEYAILNIKLLFHIENLYNMVQYYAYIASSIVIYGICKKIKISKTCGHIVCLIFMTAPIITFEATTTQNDLYACMWALFGIYILVSYINIEKIQLTSANIGQTICLAAVFAMCYLTKGTACLAVIPFAVFMVIYRIIKKDRIQTLLVHFLVGAISAVVIILPFILKNMTLFGSLFGLGNYNELLIQKFGPRYILLNFIKNVASHSAWNEYSWTNSMLVKLVEGVAGFLHINTNDPAISFFGMEYVINSGYNCDWATIPWFMILIVLSTLLFFIAKKRMIQVQKIYFVLALLSIVLTFGIIKWQPWITRLTIGAVGIACVSIGIILNSLLRDKGKQKVPYFLICAFSCFLMISPLNYMLDISIKTMGSDGNFYGLLSKQDKYEKAAEIIRENGYKNIGLKVEGNSYEYPLWKLLEDEDVTFKHVMIEGNSTEKLEDITFVPECIFIVDLPQYTDASVIEYHGKYYTCIFSDGEVLIFEKREYDTNVVIQPGDKDVFVSGFGEKEGNYIWMLGQESRMDINVGDSSEITFVMNFEILGDSQRLKIYSNKELLFDESVGTDKSKIKLTIPIKQTVEDGIELTFYHEDAISPKKLGLVDDTRELSFAIYSIELYK